MASGSTTAVYASIVGNLAIAIAKFVAAGVTGSSAMLSEGIHSLVDTGNGHRFDHPHFDGAASLVIGVILMGVAGFLGFESKGLLIGEGATAETLDSIRALAEADPNVTESGIS